MTDTETKGKWVAIRDYSHGNFYAVGENAGDGEFARMIAYYLTEPEAHAIANARENAERVEELGRVVETAEWARNRLEAHADGCHAGTIQSGGRELKRAVWAAFSDFDALTQEENKTPQAKGD